METFTGSEQQHLYYNYQGHRVLEIDYNWTGECDIATQPAGDTTERSTPPAVQTGPGWQRIGNPGVRNPPGAAHLRGPEPAGAAQLWSLRRRTLGRYGMIDRESGDDRGRESRYESSRHLRSSALKHTISSGLPFRRRSLGFFPGHLEGLYSR